MAPRDMTKQGLVSTLTPGWHLTGPPVVTMVYPGDVIISDSRHAHWPYSPLCEAGDCSTAQPCPGRVGVTFMMNAFPGGKPFCDMPFYDGSSEGPEETAEEAAEEAATGGVSDEEESESSGPPLKRGRAAFGF